MDLGAGLMIGRGRDAWREDESWARSLWKTSITSPSSHVATHSASGLVCVSISSPRPVGLYVKQDNNSV